MLVAGAAGALLYLRGHQGSRNPADRTQGVFASRPNADEPTRIVAAAVRIRIEVLNATDSRGLARQATFFLRDAGFDVVYFGNSSERSEMTVVRNRSGHADWAALAAKAMRPAVIEQRPDSSHFLDLTVLIGRNWRPPRQTLYP